MRNKLLMAALAGATVLAACTYVGTHRSEGWAKIVAEDYAGARDYYIGVLAERPDDPWAHLNLGVAYQELGQVDLARQHYEFAVEYGEYAEIIEVARDGTVDGRRATVAEVAADNLAALGV